MAILVLLLLLVALVFVAPLRLEVHLLNSTFQTKLRWLGFAFAVEPIQQKYRILIGTKQLYSGQFSRSSKAKTPRKATPQNRKSAFTWSKLLESRSRFSSIWRYLTRHLHVERFSLDLLLATPDPALTGELFGLILGFKSATAPFIRAGNVRVEADFMADWPRVRLDFQLQTRLIHLLVIGARGWLVVRQFIKKPAQVKQLQHIPA